MTLQVSTWHLFSLAARRKTKSNLIFRISRFCFWSVLSLIVPEVFSNREILDKKRIWLIAMLFYSFFKSLVGKDVVVELKNDLAIAGNLHSVDQYLNIKLTDIQVIDGEKFPYMLSVKNCFIRGSVVRYVQLPKEEVDVTLLQDATRKEANKNA